MALPTTHFYSFDNFVDLDTNSDGKLDLDEFKVLFQTGKKRLAERDVELLFANADTSHDGLLDADEFLTFLRSNMRELATVEYGLPNYGPGVSFAPMQPFRSRAARKASSNAERPHHGPTILDGTNYEHSLRSSMHNSGSTFVHTGGHVLDRNGPGHVDSFLSSTGGLEEGPKRSQSPACHRRAASHTSAALRSPCRPNSRSASRPQSQSGHRELRGPERFFYDRSTYTGVHTHGGPSTLDGKGWASTMRPGHHAGSTFTRTAGKPLDDHSARHIDSMILA